MMWGNTSTTGSTWTSNIYTITYGGISTGNWYPTYNPTDISYYNDPSLPVIVELNDGKEHQLKFPDGTIIYVEPNGNYRVCDKDAKIIYKGNNIREFNPFVNASDLLESFIKDMGKLGAKQGNALNIPINLFIHWLIFKAAEKDNDLPKLFDPKLYMMNGMKKFLPLPDVKRKWNVRCGWCGKFIKKINFENGLKFCDTVHAGLRMNLLLTK